MPGSGVVELWSVIVTLSSTEPISPGVLLVNVRNAIVAVLTVTNWLITDTAAIVVASQHECLLVWPEVDGSGGGKTPLRTDYGEVFRETAWGLESRKCFARRVHRGRMPMQSG